MGYTHGTSIDSEFRICTKCNKELPNTNEYYCYANKKLGRLESVCKECKVLITKERNKKKIEENSNKEIGSDGLKVCLQCGKELPNTKQYYPVDLTCNGGLRNVCRCCSNNYKNYLPDDYVPNERWSDEDIILLEQIYKDFTGEEIKSQYFPDRSIRAIECCAETNGFSGKSESTILRSRIQRSKKISILFKGRKLTQEQCKKISERLKEFYKTHHGFMYGKKLTKEHCQKISERNTRLGKWKGENNPRHINPLNGELNGNWQGGITNLYQELRSDTKEWQEESMKFCNYKCIITDTWFDNVHHLVPFKNIVNETFKIVNLEQLQNVSMYSNDEFENIRNVLKDLHIKYGFGVTLCKPIHKLFHDSYGYLNNTPNQFIDFIDRLKTGEFDNLLFENNLQLNINNQVIDYIKSSLLSQQTA